MGLSIAYHLAELGVRNVTVVDRSYLCGGASGRNGGGVRAQWSSEANVRLMQDSIRMCRDFASLQKINVWFRQGGYLFVARTSAVRQQLEKSVKLQNDCGLPTRMLSPAEAQRIVPELDVSGIEAASYNADDGVVFPWPFVWGYAQAATKLGVEVVPWHDVVGFDTQGSRITGVRVRQSGPTGETLDVPTTVIRTTKVDQRRAAPGRPRSRGCWASSSPTSPTATRSARPSRSSRGSSPWSPTCPMACTSRKHARRDRGRHRQRVRRPGPRPREQPRLPGQVRPRPGPLVPLLGSVKVLRQWAGCYDLTPDANPVVGPVDARGELLPGQWLHGPRVHDGPGGGQAPGAGGGPGRLGAPLDRWNLRRFEEGNLLSEAMIIG